MALKNTGNQVMIDTSNGELYIDLGADGVKQLIISDTQVLQKNTAFVEVDGDDNNAKIGDEYHPFSTIEAALDALPSNENVAIKIGLGDFQAPPIEKLRSNISFIGSGKPITDSTITIVGEGTQPTITSPTKLIGGTVIKGPMAHTNKSNVKIKNLGVDVGLEWCTNFNSGNPAEGINFCQFYDPNGGQSSQDGTHALQTEIAPMYGVEVDSVSILVKENSSPVHCLLMENLYCPKANNISTYYGMFGFVSKSFGGNFSNMDLHGHSFAGMILKSNDYAYNISLNVNNIYITSIGPYDGEGLVLQGEEGTFTPFMNISNINIAFTKNGIYTVGAVTGVTISNVKLFNLLTSGITLSGNVTYVTLNNIQARTAGAIGYSINVSGTNNFIFLNNCLASGVNTGFNLNYSGTGGRIKVSNITSLVGSSDNAFTFGSNIYGNSAYKILGSTIGTLIKEVDATLDDVAANGATTSRDILIERGTGNPNISVKNGSSGSFPLFGLIDERSGGRAWNIENGRETLGRLELLSGGVGTVFSFAPDGIPSIPTDVMNLGNFYGEDESEGTMPTASSLNATYGDKPKGFRVYYPAFDMIFTKTTTGWIRTDITVVT